MPSQFINVKEETNDQARPNAKAARQFRKTYSSPPPFIIVNGRLLRFIKKSFASLKI